MKLSRPSSWISPRRELDDLLNEIEALKSAARFLRAATEATTFQSRSVTARPDRESRVTRIASVTDIKEIRHRRSPISPENPTARDWLAPAQTAIDGALEHVAGTNTWPTAPWEPVKSASFSVDVNAMKLEKCPYDRSPIVVRSLADSYLVSCDTCGAVWEMHGSWIHRLRDPDVDIIRRVRNGLFSPDVVDSEIVSVTDVADDAVN